MTNDAKIEKTRIKRKERKIKQMEKKRRLKETATAKGSGEEAEEQSGDTSRGEEASEEMRDARPEEENSPPERKTTQEPGLSSGTVGAGATVKVGGTVHAHEEPGCVSGPRDAMNPAERHLEMSKGREKDKDGADKTVAPSHGTSLPTKAAEEQTTVDKEKAPNTHSPSAAGAAEVDTVPHTEARGSTSRSAAGAAEVDVDPHTEARGAASQPEPTAPTVPPRQLRERGWDGTVIPPSNPDPRFFRKRGGPL
jgi:hypothetical protein